MRRRSGKARESVKAVSAVRLKTCGGEGWGLGRSRGASRPGVLGGVDSTAPGELLLEGDERAGDGDEESGAI